MALKMRYYDHEKDGPSILNLDENNPLGFPRLSEASWRDFVFRKENRGGRYFLVEETEGLIETLICVSIKSSPVFRSSAYISIYGALDARILARTLSMLSSHAEISFFQCKPDDKREDIKSALTDCGFEQYEKEFYMDADASVIPGVITDKEPEIYLHPALPDQDDVLFISGLYNTAFVFDISYTEKPTDFFRQCLNSGDQIFIITHRDERVGYIHVQHDDGELWLDAIALAPAHRGKGLARAALRRLMSAHRTRFALGVSSKNASAIRLYEQCGFSLTGAQTRFVRTLHPSA